MPGARSVTRELPWPWTGGYLPMFATLNWAIRPGEDPFFGPCFSGTSGQGNGDFDGDGESICQNDCDETNVEIRTGLPELCGNQRDDNCNGQVDEEFDACDTGEFGACAQGTRQCFTTGEPASCERNSGPFQEVCNAFDDDCDGLSDEDGVCN